MATIKNAIMEKYSLKRDHAEIKEQIKEWEHELTYAVGKFYHDRNMGVTPEFEIEVYEKLIDHLEQISHDMGAINI